MDEPSSSPTFKKRKIKRLPSPPGSDEDLFSSQSELNELNDKMVEKYFDENKGDFNIVTQPSDDSDDEKQYKALLIDENNFLKQRVKTLEEENKKLKSDLKEILDKNANEFLKHENETLKEKIDELEFIILMQKSTQDEKVN